MKRTKILVVDDDPRLLSLTRELLELDGHLVRTQNSPFGTSAVAADFDPDLVLLDVNMPGLSGSRLAALLLRDADGAARKSVLYSSNDEEALREDAARVGAIGYVCKGDGGLLRRRVREYLSSG